MGESLNTIIKELYKDENLDTESALELKEILKNNIIHIKTDLK